MAKQDLPAFQKKLRRWIRMMPREMETALNRGADIVVAEVQRGHLSGPKMPRGVGSQSGATLASKTGTLRRSITKVVRVAGQRVVAKIGTRLKYAAVHEFGATIRPVRARLLRWEDETGAHFAKQVKIPARPFLRPSVQAKRPAVMEEILRAAMRGYKKA